MKYLLAIDAGTGSARAVLFNTAGKQIEVSQKEWSHLEVKGVKNSMSFSYDKNWKLICSCIKEVIKKSGIKAEDIKALSASSMREGIVLYDKNKNEVFALANVDARSAQEVKSLNKNFPKLEKKFYKKSGQTFALGALPRLLWLKNNDSKTYKKVKHISMISDWVLKKLSGEIASEPSNAGTTGIFCLKSRTWDEKMATKVGIKDDIFPKILESGDILGKVTQEASFVTGLSTKTLVVMGGGDVQLAALGLGLTEIGSCAIIGGSFWQQVVNIKREVTPPLNMNIRVNPHVLKEQSQVEAITFFSGLVMRWFRDSFCQKELELAKKKNIDIYTYLEQLSKDVPLGSYGILPIFSDQMKYSKWYHASPSFLNLSLDSNKCNIASMFKALQENAAIVSYLNLKNIEKFTAKKIKKIVFAGGAAKGIFWPQILADVTGIEVHVPKIKEATSLGCIIFAGIAAGIYKDVNSASKDLVKIQKIYLPDLENHKKYKKIATKWQKAYEMQIKLVDKNITNSMWKAPGL